jgi:hypothetical protein
LESALYKVLVPEQLFFLNLSQFSKMIWKAGPRRSVHFLDSELQNLTGHLGVDTPMPTLTVNKSQSSGQGSVIHLMGLSLVCYALKIIISYLLILVVMEAKF